MWRLAVIYNFKHLGNSKKLIYPVRATTRDCPYIPSKYCRGNPLWLPLLGILFFGSCLKYTKLITDFHAKVARNFCVKLITDQLFIGNSNKASTKRFASKGRKSSTCSPTPIKRIGKPICLAIANTIPPLAVPSNLVIVKPVTPIA